MHNGIMLRDPNLKEVFKPATWILFTCSAKTVDNPVNLQCTMTTTLIIEKLVIIQILECYLYALFFLLPKTVTNFSKVSTGHLCPKNTVEILHDFFVIIVGPCSIMLSSRLVLCSVNQLWLKRLVTTKRCVPQCEACKHIGKEQRVTATTSSCPGESI